MMTKEENQAYHRAYYLAHKERMKAQTRARHVANKERDNARGKAWYLAHRDQQIAREKVRGREVRAARRARIIAKYGGACACCGESRGEFLGIDHINGGGRKHRREVNGNVYAWLEKNNYPGGFRVLCHNCNQAPGVYGRCPHDVERSAAA